MEKLIYLDNAATTAMKPEVFEAMKPYFVEEYSNPASIYTFGQRNKSAIEDAREQIAQTIGAKKNEIYFTSGGSESDNWAFKATADAYRDKGNHIITTKIEHHAVLHAAQYLEKHGFEVTYLDVDEDGMVNLEQLEKAIRPTTILISVMFANNEIGTIEPIAEIGRIAHKHGVLFHTDAVQAFAHIPIHVEELQIDMLSASAHKFHGPKGVGFFYLRNSVKLGAFIHGGSQERARRGGTSNVPGIVGMAKAAKLAIANLDENIRKQTALRNAMIKRITDEIPFVKVNGSLENRLPNNVNISFRFIEGESLLIMLDQYGICASSGSACTSGSLDPSHVLLAIGLPHELAHGSIRFSISEETTKEDIDFTIERLKPIVERLRSMSPLYEDFLQASAKGKE